MKQNNRENKEQNKGKNNDKNDGNNSIRKKKSVNDNSRRTDSTHNNGSE